MKLKVDHFKQQAEFFGKMFRTHESRDGDLKDFLAWDIKLTTRFITRMIAPYLCEVSFL